MPREEDNDAVETPEETNPLFIKWCTYLNVFDKLNELRQNYLELKQTALGVQPSTQDYQSDLELKHEIDKDLMRLYPKGNPNFFQNSTYQKILQNILFIWCKQHPEISYRQGYHDLAAIIMYMQLQQLTILPTIIQTPFGEMVEMIKIHDEDINEMIVRLGNATTTNEMDLVQAYVQTNDTEVFVPGDHLPHLEHDSFILFNEIMKIMQPFYESAYCEPKAQVHQQQRQNTNQLFKSSEDHNFHRNSGSTKSHLQQVAHYIQYDLLRQHHPTLCHHLQAMEVYPETYSIRWIRLLFAREFTLDETLILWEAILSQLQLQKENVEFQPTFILYVCAALIITQEEQLLQGDNVECLQILMSEGIGNNNNNTQPVKEALGDVQQLLALTNRMINPFLEQAEENDIQVIKFDKGSLGVVLTSATTPYAGMLAVRGFRDLADGVLGQAQESGKIQLGDLVVSINGIRIGSKTPEGIKRHLDCVHRPVYIGFQRPSIPAILPSPSSGAASLFPVATNGLDQDDEDQDIVIVREDEYEDKAIDAEYVPVYCPGEKCFANAEVTRTEVHLTNTGTSITQHFSGRLFLSNYRIMYHRFMSDGIQWQCPVLSVLRVEGQEGGQTKGGRKESFLSRANFSSNVPSSYHVTVHAKDGQIGRFGLSSYQDYARILKCLQFLAFPASILDAFCFSYTPYIEQDMVDDFDIRVEYERLGLMPHHPHFRSINQNYQLCSTYPQHLIVPETITDVELHDIAQFRSRGRFPVATWIHATNGAVISRSSQPLVGLKSTRCTADEDLVQHLCCASSTSKSLSYSILDARGQLAAMGNKTMGKGTEVTAHYRGAEIHFMNIDNIHAMRNSAIQLRGLYQESTSSSPLFDLSTTSSSSSSPFITSVVSSFRDRTKVDSSNASGNNSSSSYYGDIDASSWLKHIRMILKASTELAKGVHYGQSALVHCSDGWDRTSQLVALAQVMLDPFYRTIHGISVLIEKDWCAFGHQFDTRCGHMKRDASNDQRSPIFLCWLDALWQILRQFPHRFEFNEALLIFLADHVYSCRFINFMCDTERERNGLQAKRRAASIWNYILTNRTKFINTNYDADAVNVHQRDSSQNAPIFINYASKNIRIWESYFGRWDPTLVPGVLSQHFYD